MKNLMIDIESMALSPHNALVLTVGLQVFSLEPSNRPEYGPAKEYALNIAEQLLLKREVDPGTQDWWAKQRTEVSDRWVNPPNGYTRVAVFAEELTNLCGTLDKGYVVWARGPQFDLVNLDNLVRSVGAELPWCYDQIRDVRTVCKLFPERRKLEAKTVPDELAHCALADCRYQVEDLWTRVTPEILGETPAPSLGQTNHTNSAVFVQEEGGPIEKA